MRENLQSVERQTGKTLIDNPAPPSDAAHIWEWFWELNPGRPMGAMGDPGALTYSEIDAWARLTLAAPEAWEIAAIRAMDAAFVSAFGKYGGK